MMIGEGGTLKRVETCTFRHFIQRAFRDKDKVWNGKYCNILRF